MSVVSLDLFQVQLFLFAWLCYTSGTAVSLFLPGCVRGAGGDVYRGRPPLQQHLQRPGEGSQPRWREQLQRDHLPTDRRGQRCQGSLQF